MALPAGLRRRRRRPEICGRCHLGRSEGPETLILGDSFSIQIYQRLAAKTDLEGSFTFLTSSGCAPITGFRLVKDVLRCNGYFEKAFAYAAQRNPARIVLISNWFAYFNPANEKICFFEGESCMMRLNDPDWFVPHVETMFAGLGEILRKFKGRGTEVVIISATPYGKWNVPADFYQRASSFSAWIRRRSVFTTGASSKRTPPW